MALSARGAARVLADPMPGAEDYVAVAIDIEVIDDHRQGAFLVETGIARTVIDEGELEYLRSRYETLRETGPRRPVTVASERTHRSPCEDPAREIVDRGNGFSVRDPVVGRRGRDAPADHA
ncbi:hypothetical protein ACWEKT_35685 [Nocardia takedensis]